MGSGVIRAAASGPPSDPCLLQIHAFVLAPPAVEALGADVVLATDLLSPMPVSASLSIRIICSVVRIVFSSMMSFR